MNKKSYKKLLIHSFLCCFLFGTALSNDWTSWRGPNKNGISMESEWNPAALNKGPGIIWKTNIGKGYSSLTTRGQRLYTLGNVNNVDIIYCLDVNTGKEIWRYSYPCTDGPSSYPGTESTPVVDSDYVYSLSKEGHLFCLNSDNAKVRWHVHVVSELKTIRPHFGFAGSPNINGDILLLNVDTSGLALDKNTGKKIWSSPPLSCSNATPVIFQYGKKRMAAIFSSKQLNVVEVSSGKVQGWFSWDTNFDENSADPLVIGDKIFISSAYKKGCALLKIRQNGLKLLWKNMNMSNLFSSSVYLDGYIYGIDGERRKTFLKCIDINTGEEKWKKKMKFGSLIAADGKLIVLDETGKIFIAEVTPNSYKEISSGKVLIKPFCWTAPVLSEGRLYIRNSIGDLLCVDMRK